MKLTMRYFWIVLLACSVVVGCSGHGDSVLNRLDRFVDMTEKRADTYNSDDWELSEVQYEKIVESLESGYDNMTREQKERALKAIGRYNGLLVKHSMQKGADVLEEISKALPSLIEGFTGAFDDLDLGVDDMTDSTQDSQNSDNDTDDVY